MNNPTEPMPFGDVMEPMLQAIEGIVAGGTWRWPRQRTGTREPIPGITRRLVLARDNFRCTLCDARHSLELDHIVPWSAGGSDWSENLRTLCWEHNLDRSNYREAYLPRVLPVIVVCDPCLTNHTDERIVGRHDRTTYWRYCPLCRGTAWESGTERHNAWCGTCTTDSWTSNYGATL